MGRRRIGSDALHLSATGSQQFPGKGRLLNVSQHIVQTAPKPSIFSCAPAGSITGRSTPARAEATKPYSVNAVTRRLRNLAHIGSNHSKEIPVSVDVLEPI